MLSGSQSPANPTVIFVHGLRTSAAMWDEQVRALTAAGFPTRAIDLPGHGTKRGETFTMVGAIDTIDRTVASLERPRYVLVGLSLGGYTALHYASQVQLAGRACQASQDGGHTEQEPAPGPLGVVAAACSSDPSTKPVRAYRNIAAWVVGAWTRLRNQPPPSDQLPWSVVTEALTALAPVSSIADIKRADAPVLLLNGKWDHLRLEERAHLAAARQGRLVVIPGAKHEVSLEAPVQFNRTLLQFLSSLPAPQLAAH